MATTVEPHGANQSYVDPDEYIDFQLAKTQSQIKTTEILTSASWLGIAVLSYVLTFVVLDQWVIPGGFGYWARAIWLGLLAVGGGAWLVWRILMPWFRTIHELYAAKMIESADPTLKSSLLNLIDLQLHGQQTQSPTVRTSMEKRAAVELSKVDVDHAVNHQSLLRLAYALLAVIVVCSFYVMFSPKDAFSSVQRLLLPASRTSVATRTTITNVSPEDTKVLTGELLTVEADILGQAPEQVTLVYTTEDHEFVNQPVEMQRLEEGISRFRGVVSGEKGRGLMQSMTYRIEAGDARTRDYRVQVVEPPSSKVENVRYTAPAYTKLDPKVLSGGNIDGWEGTKVVVSATTNLPVQSALLVMTDTENPHAKGEEIRMTIRDGKHLTADWTLAFRSDGTFARYYHIDCTTAAGESDPLPTVYAIKIQPDQRPDVALLHPTQDLERPANAVVPLLVKAADPDFQLRFVTLRVEKAGEEIHSASLLDEERQAFEGTHDLQLEQLGAGGLKPGDEILYWIEARDNKQPHGNRSTTPRMKIKISPPAKADQIAQQLEQDRLQQQEQLAQADPDRNPNEQEQRPEAEPEKGQRPPQPPKNKPEQKPEPKPGEPQPQEDPARPDEPKNPDEEKPGEPRPDKPEADQQQKPGKADKNKPMPGNKGQEQRQPNEQGTGQPEGGKSDNSQTDKNDQSDKPEANDGKSKPTGDGSGSNSKPRKKVPADDQTALQELIRRQQQDGESNPEEPPENPPAEKDSNSQQPGTGDRERPGAEKKPGQSPMPKEKQPAEDPQDKKTEKASKPDQTGKPESDTEKSKTGGDEPGKKQSGDGNQSKSANKSKNEANRTAGNEKSPAEQKSNNAPNTSRQPKSNDTEKPEQGTPQSDNPQSDPNNKSMKKKSDGDGEPGQPNEKSEAEKPQNEPTEKNEKNSAKDSKSGPTAKKQDDNKNPMNQPGKSPDGKAGTAEDANSQEKSAAKAKGAGNKPTNEEAPDDADTTQQGPGNKKAKPKPDANGEKPQPGTEESHEKMPDEESPADAGPDAVKKKATGDEKGPAEGQERPETGSAPKAKNELERKPESKPGAMRKSDEPRQPGTKTERGSKDPNDSKVKPDGSVRPDEQKAGTNKDSKQPPEKRPGTEASQDEPNPGKGQPNQKSKKSDSGEAGGNTPQDQGTPGSKQKGTGDTQPQPGNQAPDKMKQGGEPGKKPGEGTTTQPTDKNASEKKAGEPSSDEGEPESKPGENQAEDGTPMPGKNESKPGEPGKQSNGQPKPGQGQPGKTGQPQGMPPKGGQPGKGVGQGGTPGEGAPSQPEPGEDDGNGPGEPRGERKNLPPAEQDQAAQEAEEKANEEFARKASNLILKKLRKDLDRGEVDQKLLDELGWTKEDMEQFVQRLDQQLQDTKSNDESPEAIARRRQFEETLKTLGLSAKTKKRTATAGKTTRVNEVGVRKIEPPPEYKELFEEYTKELAKPATKK